MGEILSSARALEMADGKSSDFHSEWVYRHLHERGASTQDEILDFGAGSGALLRKLSGLGFDRLHGMDLLPCPPLAGIKWWQTDLNAVPHDATSTRYDWVTSVEVLEHLENPRQALRSMSALLKPNGTLILTTPNVESLRSLISLCLRGHFVDFLDSSYPAHITPIIAMDLRRILSEVKLRLLLFEYSHRGAIPGFTGATWQALSLGALRGKHFSDHFLVVARKEA